MKKIIIISVVAILWSCTEISSDETITPLITSRIVGTWQLNEALFSSGGTAVWEIIENGEILDFKIDGTFVKSKTEENTNVRSGKYVYEGNVLQLTFKNDDKTEVQSFSVEMDTEENSIITTPNENTICVELCSLRYKRIK